MLVIMKHDQHGHCFAYNTNDIARLKALGWYEKPTELPVLEKPKKPNKRRK